MFLFESSSVCDLLALAPFCNYDVKADSFKESFWEDLKSTLLCTGGLVLRQNPCFLLSTGVMSISEFLLFGFVDETTSQVLLLHRVTFSSSSYLVFFNVWIFAFGLIKTRLWKGRGNFLDCDS